MSLPDLPRLSEARLVPYLVAEGFTALDREPWRMGFVRGQVVLEVMYWPEDAPPRPLMVGLGLVDPDEGRRMIGLWALDPPRSTTGYESQRFSTDEELATLLKTLIEDDLPTRAAAYWTHPDRLVPVLEREEARTEAEYQEGARQRHLTAARASFRARRFQEAIDQYALAGGGLTRADEQRRSIARREVGPT